MYCSSDLTHVGCRWLHRLVVVVRMSRGVDVAAVGFDVVIRVSKGSHSSSASLTLIFRSFLFLSSCLLLCIPYCFFYTVYVYVILIVLRT